MAAALGDLEGFSGWFAKYLYRVVGVAALLGQQDAVSGNLLSNCGSSGGAG